MVILPLEGPETGVVFTTKLPSTSESPESVRSPLTGVSNPVMSFSLSTTGGSLTGFTVIVMVWFTH